MKSVFGYVFEYFRSLNLVVFLCCTLFIAIAIFCNYYFDLNTTINTFDDVAQFASWYFIFLTVFFFGYFIQAIVFKHKLFQNRIFCFLLLFAPALFAWKMMAHYTFNISVDIYKNSYWNHVVYWPLKLLVIASILYMLWRRFSSEQPFYGTATTGFRIEPYLGMLVFMLPLLALAATQNDFLAIYPKLQKIYFLQTEGAWYHKLFYELAYGSDFISIELFFRGFLVLAFAKWAGKNAILPMALFYCTIHFGKPLGECISSYFGGMVLGAVTLQTRSIWGGLMVHLGIAWLMEAFGFLGHNLFL